MAKQRHYYNAPAGEGELQSHDYEILGEKVQLLTSGGTFSKRGLDLGTKLLLETVMEDLRSREIQPRRALDLGCGNGVVSVFLHLFFPELEILASDVSPRCVELTRLNTKHYPQISVIEADGIATEYAHNAFDLVLLNPPIRAGKDVCYRLYKETASALRSTGALYIVVRKQQGALSHAAELHRLYQSVDLLIKKKGYFIYRAVKEA